MGFAVGGCDACDVSASCRADNERSPGKWFGEANEAEAHLDNRTLNVSCLSDIWAAKQSRDCQEKNLRMENGETNKGSVSRHVTLSDRRKGSSVSLRGRR